MTSFPLLSALEDEENFNLNQPLLSFLLSSLEDTEKENLNFNSFISGYEVERVSSSNNSDIINTLTEGTNLPVDKVDLAILTSNTLEAVNCFLLEEEGFLEISGQDLLLFKSE